MTKVCPLKQNGDYFQGRNCDEELCAWWDFFEHQCSILTIATKKMEEN